MSILRFTESSFEVALDQRSSHKAVTIQVAEINPTKSRLESISTLIENLFTFGRQKITATYFILPRDSGSESSVCQDCPLSLSHRCTRQTQIREDSVIRKAELSREAARDAGANCQKP